MRRSSGGFDAFADAALFVLHLVTVFALVGASVVVLLHVERFDDSTPMLATVGLLVWAWSNQRALDAYMLDKHGQA